MKLMNRGMLLAILAIALILAAACASQKEPTPASVAEEPAAESPADSDAGAPADAESAPGLRTFVVATDESSASYIVDEEFLPDMLSKYGIEAGRVDTVGTTPAVEGQLELNLDDLTAPLGDNAFRVDLSQLTSDQALRDEWVQARGPQFSQYPTAEFVATGVQNAPQEYVEGQPAEFQLAGDLHDPRHHPARDIQRCGHPGR